MLAINLGLHAWNGDVGRVVFSEAPFLLLLRGNLREEQNWFSNLSNGDEIKEL